MSPRMHDVQSVLQDAADGATTTECLALLRARLGHPVDPAAFADAAQAFRDRQLHAHGLADARHITGRLAPCADYDTAARQQLDAALDDAVLALVQACAA